MGRAPQTLQRPKPESKARDGERRQVSIESMGAGAVAQVVLTSGACIDLDLACWHSSKPSANLPRNSPSSIAKVVEART